MRSYMLKKHVFQYNALFLVSKLVKDILRLINLKECSAATLAKRTAKISDFILWMQVALLAQHAHSRRVYFRRCHMPFLIDRDYAIAQAQPTLQLLCIANGKHRVGPRKAAR